MPRRIKDWLWDNALQIGIMIAALATMAAKLNAALDRKADTSSVEEIRFDIKLIREKLNEMDERQRQFYCDDKPAWCR